MATTKKKKAKTQPPQHQKQHPGKESLMHPQPEYIRKHYKGCGKLLNKIAIVTGGDSGIGRAVAVHFANEGAHVVVVYLKEHGDAKKTRLLVEAADRECLLIAGDLREASFCKKVVNATVRKFKTIDILVNNGAEQHYEPNFEKIPHAQIVKTFETNIFSMFYLTQQALPHMEKGSCIINSTSVTAFRGSEDLIDYAATKGAILAFTRSLSTNLVDKEIRVNAVAPGPIWTPFIPSSFPAEKVKDFGKDQPMRRAGQPSEVAPCFVFLASADSSYMTGQVLHPNGGEIVGA